MTNSNNIYTLPKPKGQMVEVFEAGKRFNVIVAARRIGKTLNAILWLAEGALTGNTKLKYWYIAPTRIDGRDIAWDLMKRACSDIITKSNDTRLEVTLINGGKISIKGANDVERLRGRAIGRAVLDEFGDMKHKTTDYMSQSTPLGVLMPAIRAAGGSCIVIGSPKGKNHFEKLYMDMKNGKSDEWGAFHFKAIDSPFVPRDGIEKARLEMNPAMFRQEYEASFEAFEGQLFDYNDLTACETIDIPIGIPVRAWDLATTKNTYSDYTVGGLYSIKNDNMALHDLIRGRWEYPEAREIIINTAHRDGRGVPIVIESVGGFKAVYQDIKKELQDRGFNVFEEKRNLTGDKFAFSMPIQRLVKTGKFHIESAFYGEVIGEWMGLTNNVKEWVHDDILDTASMAYEYLNKFNYKPTMPITGTRERGYKQLRYNEY